LDNEMVLLDHGSGGKLGQELVEKVFLRLLDGVGMRDLDDGARLEARGASLAVTTDSFVVDPLFFPGGDIGHLAVCGTVNDLAACAAEPLCLTAAFILEEGFPLRDLRTIVESMVDTARQAGVRVVTGDTKVVPRGKADGVFINTTGVGMVVYPFPIGGRCALPGDRVLISGPVGEHGTAVLAARAGLSLQTPVRSDARPLWSLTRSLLSGGAEVHALRDPTRGGVASALNEIAFQSRVGIEIDEGSVPCGSEVRAACDLLGLDPLVLANEGKMLVIVKREHADLVLETMKRHPDGAGARCIGETVSGHPGKVVIRTAIGGTRLLDAPTGEAWPRIC
jgi:hydrogenase expression/formation protein HypE